MSRPPKDGVGYFPKDTDFYGDDKVKILRAEFGAKGMYLLDYLLCDLYSKNGYFIKWDRSKCFLVSDGAGCGCSPELIEEFVKRCVACSFFDERVFNMFHILTSPGIQRRYVRMFNGRDNIVIIKEYFLLDVNSEKDIPHGILNKLAFKNLNTKENPDKSTENPDKSTENTQNKLNKNKLNISIYIPPEISEEWEAYTEMRNKIKKPMTDYAAKLLLDKLNKLAPSDFEKQKKILNQSVLNCWQGLFDIKHGKPAENTEKGSFKTDDFFEKALRRSYKER